FPVEIDAFGGSALYIAAESANLARTRYRSARLQLHHFPLTAHLCACSLGRHYPVRARRAAESTGYSSCSYTHRSHGVPSKTPTCSVPELAYCPPGPALHAVARPMA